MPYDKRKQFGKHPSNIHDNPELVGIMNCFKVNEDGYCDWCHHKHQKENLWYSKSSHSWMCSWCREIRELEFKIEDIAKDRNEKNNIKTFYLDMYPYNLSE